MVRPAHIESDPPKDDSAANMQTGIGVEDPSLAHELSEITDTNVLRHFYGSPVIGAPQVLRDAAIVCLSASWWQKEPYPTTELGIAELTVKGLAPTAHAENVLLGMRVAHARIKNNAHLHNYFAGSGDPEDFSFGTTKFVDMEEAKDIIVNTFTRSRLADGDSGALQPIILVGHAIENLFYYLKQTFKIDLLSYGTIVKVIDTQKLAWEAGIYGPKGPNISLQHLLENFKIRMHNLHTAGNDAAATLIAAVLTALTNDIYLYGIPQSFVLNRDIQDVIERTRVVGKSEPPPPWGQAKFCTRCNRDNHMRWECYAQVYCYTCEHSGVVRLFNARKTHSTAKCLYKYLKMPPSDHHCVKNDQTLS